MFPKFFLFLIILFPLFFSAVVFAQPEIPDIDINSPAVAPNDFQNQYQRALEFQNQVFNQMQKEQSFIMGISKAVFIVIAVLGLLSIALLIWVLIDISKSTKDNAWKLMWGGACLVFGLAGIKIFFFVGGEKKNKNTPRKQNQKF